MNLLQMEDDSSSAAQKKHTFTPKLRKNKRLEKRWGLKYFNAVKEAVFTMSTAPYMPLEPSMSSDEETGDPQPLYVCKQCRDCFRFLSSLEDHNNRHSWILGYWCQNCFSTDCSHVPLGEIPCEPCQTIERNKKFSLRLKGLKKGRKMGSIKIFYNQCHFFAHLKSHQTAIVDMGDVMLMPMPVDIEREQYEELDKVCSVIMEHMFLTRTHIMDWLRIKQFGKKWWGSMRSKDEDPMVAILAAIQSKPNVRRTRNSYVFRKSASANLPSPSKVSLSSGCVTSTPIPVVDANQDRNDTPKDSSLVIQEASVASNDSVEVIEGDDDPCMAADIAFVDCGPTAKTYPSDVSLLLTSTSNMTLTDSVSSVNCSLETVTDRNQALATLTRSTSSAQGNVPATQVVFANSSSIMTPLTDSSFTPKISVKKFASEMPGSPPASSLWQDFSREYNQKKQTVKRVLPRQNATQGSTKTMPALFCPKLEKLPVVNKVNLASRKLNLQTLTSKSSPRILTVHSPKNADLSAIISKLPPEVINGKKIVFIGQDSERITILPKVENFSGPGMIQIKSEPGQSKIIKTVPLKMASTALTSVGSDQKVKSISGSAIQKMLTDPVGSKVQQVSLDGKIIYQNGRKFIIRHTPKPGGSGASKLLTTSTRMTSTFRPFVSKPNSVMNKTTAPKSTEKSITKIIPIPALPTPPEQSSSTLSNPETRQITENQPNFILCSTNSPTAVEHLWIETDALGKYYYNSSKVYPNKFAKGHSWQQVAQKYKQQMFDNLLHLSKTEIKKRLDHLVDANAKYANMMSVTSDQRTLRNLEAIKYLETALEEPALWSTDPELSDKDSDDENLSEMDTQESLETTKCSICDKPTRPKSYIVGYSKSSEDGPVYCQCDNFICHICNVFQGNMTRFSAHLNYHSKEKPYTCPECFRKFPSFQRLETHQWTTCFHPLARRWFLCRVCHVEGFLDMESLTRHFAITHSESKIACPVCRVFLISRSALKKHQAESHSEIAEPLKPIRLTVCDLGHCVVRPENYRTHMDDHMGVLRVLFYKCPFCEFGMKETERGRDQIKSHLLSCHSGRLTEVVSEVCLPEILLSKQCDSIKSQQQQNHCERSSQSCDSAGESLKVSVDNAAVTQFLQDASDGMEYAQNTGTVSMIPKIVSTRTITPEVFELTKNSGDFVNATLTKKTLTDGVECSVWSIDLESTSLPRIMDVRSEASKFLPSVQDAIDGSNNSLSPDVDELPRILDVRSISPSSSLGLPETVDQLNNKSVQTPQSDREDQPATNVPKTGDSTTNEPIAESAVASQDAIADSADVSRLDGATEACQRTGELLTDLDQEVEERLRKEDETQATSTLESSGEETNTMETPNTASNLYDDLPSMSQMIVLRTEHGQLESNELIMCSVSKPPPLSRIPQHLLDAAKLEIMNEKAAEQTLNQPVIKRRRRRRRPWRIALNGPIFRPEVSDYCCHLCGELINTAWPVVKNHFSVRHSRDYELSIITPRLLRMSDEFIKEGYKEVLASRKRRSDIGGAGPKRRRRWTPRKFIEKKPEEGLGLYVKQESVQDGQGNFMCKKCEHVCDDMTRLREHIAVNHRIKDHYLICLECGENFVVAPSLQMHLKAFHGIDDPITYMTRNTAYAPEVTDDGEGEASTAVANQCHVCMAVFEDKAAVDKHLRVHGMAFLNRKRIEAKNALNSPEKKAKLENESSSSANSSLNDSAKDDQLLANGAKDCIVRNGNISTSSDQAETSDDKPPE